MLVDAKGISVYLGKRKVIEPMNVTVSSGKLIGLIGPNGAGKSTLVKAMAGLLPFQGALRVLDMPVRESSRKRLSQAMSYISQSREVHWPLTVKRIVALGRLPHLQPWERMSHEDEENVNSSMREVDVFHLRNRPINELAGGERALVLLARGLATKPKLLLADEPVAGLDPGHQIQVMELLRQKTQEGCGVLVVLHDLALASRFCDELYLIHEGNLIAAGDPKNVLTERHLKQSYGVQAYFGENDGEMYVLPWRQIK